MKCFLKKDLVMYDKEMAVFDNAIISLVNNQYSFNQCNQYSLINECFNSDVCTKEITKEEAVNAYEL